MRLIGRIDEKNFLILKFSLSIEPHEKGSENEEVCLRMAKTKAQRQSMVKAVQQTATFTTSILISASCYKSLQKPTSSIALYYISLYLR